MIANNLLDDSDPKTMAMAECKPLARTETIEACNPSRISLALPNEFHMGFNMFCSGNRMRTTRW
jgi:hypothetical protein